MTDGVDCSTGPLGQGIANAVGIALAEAYLGAKFNRAGFKVVNHYTYALCGDGCLEEGISYEASVIALRSFCVSFTSETSSTCQPKAAKRIAVFSENAVDVSPSAIIATA